MNEEKYIKLIMSELHQWLLGIGFKQLSGELYFYLKDSIKFCDLITIVTECNDSEIVVGIQLFSRKIKLIESYWEEYINNPIYVSSVVVDTIRGGNAKISHHINSQNLEPDTVKTLCEKVKSDYYNLVLPMLDEYSNIHKLDTIASGNDKTFSLGNSERYFRKLIISKLAGNSEYENIYKEMTEMYKKIIQEEPNDKYYQNMLSVIEKLYEKLKDVEPLANPVLV